MARKLIGIDTNGTKTRLVELTKSYRSFTVEKADTLETPPVFNDGNGGDSGASIHIPFPQDLVTSRVVHFPFSSAKKLDMAVPFELESWVPNSGDEFIADFQVVKRDRGGAMALVAGVSKDKMRGWIAQCDEKGVRPRQAVPEGYAFRNLAKLLNVPPETVLMFIDISETRGIIAVTMGDRSVAARSFWWSENESKAESIEKAFSRMASEAANMARFLAAEEGIEPEKLIISGESAHIEGLAEFFGDRLGIEAELWTPPGGTEEEMGPEYALALAIALEESHPIKGINLRKGEFLLQSDTAMVGQALLMPVLIIFGLIVISLLNSLFSNRDLKVKAATLDAEITAIVQGLMPDKKISPANAAETLRAEIEKARLLEESIGKTDYLTPLQALTAISQLIPPDLEVNMQQISLNDTILTLTGVITEYSQMDEIQNALKQFDAFKKFDPPQLREMVKRGEDGGVRFVQKIFLTDEGEVN